MPTAGSCEVIIAKHRNGSLDNVKLKFIGKFTKFTDADFASGRDSGSRMTFPSKANGGQDDLDTSATSGFDLPEDEGPAPF